MNGQTEIKRSRKSAYAANLDKNATDFIALDSYIKYSLLHKYTVWYTIWVISDNEPAVIHFIMLHDHEVKVQAIQVH